MCWCVLCVPCCALCVPCVVLVLGLAHRCQRNEPVQHRHARGWTGQFNRVRAAPAVTFTVVVRQLCTAVILPCPCQVDDQRVWPSAALGGAHVPERCLSLCCCVLIVLTSPAIAMHTRRFLRRRPGASQFDVATSGDESLVPLFRPGSGSSPLSATSIRPSCTSSSSPASLVRRLLSSLLSWHSSLLIRFEPPRPLAAGVYVCTCVMCECHSTHLAAPTLKPLHRRVAS